MNNESDILLFILYVRAYIKGLFFAKGYKEFDLSCQKKKEKNIHISRFARKVIQTLLLFLSGEATKIIRLKGKFVGPANRFVEFGNVSFLVRPFSLTSFICQCERERGEI